MTIIGYRGLANLFYVPVIIRTSSYPDKIIKLRFYIDTGASIIVISDTDAIKNQIDYQKLGYYYNSIQVVGSSVRTRILPDCLISFLNHDNTLYRSKYNFLNILDRGDKINANNNPQISLLGINFLQNFRISFNGDNIYLDSPTDFQQSFPILPIQ